LDETRTTGYELVNAESEGNDREEHHGERGMRKGRVPEVLQLGISERLIEHLRLRQGDGVRLAGFD
jgi:hypothetical protein